MISKELFCKTIADVQEQNRKISEFNHALGKICNSDIAHMCELHTIEL